MKYEHTQFRYWNYM